MLKFHLKPKDGLGLYNPLSRNKFYFPKPLLGCKSSLFVFSYVKLQFHCMPFFFQDMSSSPIYLINPDPQLKNNKSTQIYRWLGVHSTVSASGNWFPSASCDLYDTVTVHKYKRRDSLLTHTLWHATSALCHCCSPLL